MIYYIVHKIENDNSQLKYTAIGYVTSTSDRDAINNEYNTTLGDWLSENAEGLANESVSLSSYFDSDPIVHSCLQETTSVDGTNLSDITGLV